MSDSVQPRSRQPSRFPHPWDSPGKNTGVGCHFLLQCMKAKSESEVAQSCPTISNPMDCSLPGSSVHGIFQARVLEWGAIAFSEKHTEKYKITVKTIQISTIHGQRLLTFASFLYLFMFILKLFYKIVVILYVLYYVHLFSH